MLLKVKCVCCVCIKHNINREAKELLGISITQSIYTCNIIHTMYDETLMKLHLVNDSAQYTIRKDGI